MRLAQETKKVVEELRLFSFREVAAQATEEINDGRRDAAADLLASVSQLHVDHPTVVRVHGSRDKTLLFEAVDQEGHGALGNLELGAYFAVRKGTACQEQRVQQRRAP